MRVSIGWATGLLKPSEQSCAWFPAFEYVERTDLSKAIKELKLQDTALVDPATASKLGKIVGAKYVIVGSYQKVEDALKVDARVVDVETSVATKSTDDTGTMPGVFDLEASLATKLIAALGLVVPESSAQAVAKPATESLSAYEWCSKGDQAKAAADADEVRADNKAHTDQAVADYTQAIAIEPSADAYRGRGLTYQSNGEYDKAIADYTNAIAIKPDDGLAYDCRGLAYSGQREYDKAIADLNKAIAMRPDDARAYNDRSLVYVDRGEFEKALSDCDLAIAIEPSSHTYFRRANTYVIKRAYDKAITDFNKVIALAPAGSQEAALAKMFLSELRNK